MSRAPLWSPGLPGRLQQGTHRFRYEPYQLKVIDDRAAFALLNEAEEKEEPCLRLHPHRCLIPPLAVRTPNPDQLPNVHCFDPSIDPPSE
jgi:hypothetical protein